MARGTSDRVLICAISRSPRGTRSSSAICGCKTSACYELQTKCTRLRSVKHANATKCRPAGVAASRS
jgi:hypothetical protein